MRNEPPHPTQPDLPDLTEIERECLCLQARKTPRTVTQWYDACLQPSGLRSTQFSLLVAIALAQTVPLTRLAAALMLDRTTLTTNLKPLEAQGLLVIERGDDRRTRLIRLTDRGHQRLQQALPYWRKAQEQMRARLGQSQWDALRADLQNLTAQVPAS